MRAPARWNKAINSCFGSAAVVRETIFFESMKNQVTLLTLGGSTQSDFDVIAKMFCWGERRTEEAILLRATSLGLKVPKVIGSYRNVLFMEYLRGPDLRLFLRNNVNYAVPIIHKVTEWLAGFHRAFEKGNKKTLLKGDLRLQNFILRDGEVFGVDFEESRYGDVIYDVADLCATLVMTPWKGIDGAEVAEIFLDRYKSLVDIDTSLLPGLVQKNVDRLAEFKSAREREMRAGSRGGEACDSG